MSSPSQAKGKGKRESIGYDDSLYKPPEIVLLNEEHWSYVRRRFHMTPRELQVAKLVCRGLNNEEIARKLKIKPGTAKTHLRNIYRRIRVKNKVAMLLKLLHQATKFSAKSGITPPIPIVEIKKPVKKPAAPVEIRKKEE